MKKFKFIFFAALVLAALSCQKESFPKATPESDLIPLVLTTGDATKTYIADNGKDIHWHSGDKIKVYSDISVVGDVAQSYDFTMPNGFSPTGNYAKFEGKVVLGTNKVWAVYPSELASGATDTGILQVKLPATQNPYNGGTHSFSQNLNISVATAPVKLEYEFGDVTTQRPVVSENMTFYNTCALVKFTIPSGITNIKNVTVSTDQDIVGDMTIDYSGTIPAFGGIANGSKSISMTAAETFADGRDYYFVLAPVAISKLSIYVNTTDNKQYAATQTFTTPYQLVAGKYISLGKLNINNMPSFGVDFDIQDESGVLNGTDVIFSFPSNKISNLNLTISKEGGSAVRTIKVDGPVTLNEYNQYISSYANETVSTWPYLPRGTYTVSGTYDTEGGAASVNNITFEINTYPNFTVGSFEAYTSYTKYTSKTSTAVADANACDGASIYVNASNVSISDKILKNSNYKDMIQVQFVAPAQGYGVANLTNGLTATLTNQQYGEYKSPSYIFDEKAVTFSTLSCHVTGLPYVLNPAGNDSVNPWGVASTNDILYVSWTGSALKVGGGSVGANVGAIKSFYVPEKTQINVTASASGSVTGGRTNANTGSVKLGGKELVSSTAEKGGLFSGTKTVTFSKTDSESMSISTSNSQLSCSVTYGLSEAHMLVKSLTILYR